jgi:5-aminolevulinate synthase
MLNVVKLHQHRRNNAYGYLELDNFVEEEYDVERMNSTDYLGLGQNYHIVQSAMHIISTYGLGIDGNTLLGGLTDLHLELSQKLSYYFKAQDTFLTSNATLSNFNVLQNNDCS